MKKVTSLLLILTISVIFGSCEQARVVMVTYNCELTHFYTRHTTDLDKLENYINEKGRYDVGTSFGISVYGKNDEVCIEEADQQAKETFNYFTNYFSKYEVHKLLGEETEFEYSFCRVNDNGDTLKIVSYQYNME